MPKGNSTNNNGWNNKWSEEELDILKKNYPIGGVQKVIQLLPNRSHKAILSMAAKHKINQWSYIGKM